MLSIAPLTGGPGYYLELASLNYYAEGGEPLPIYHGTAARELGLSGVAQKEHVYRLAAGFDPETGSEKLVRNAGKQSRNPGHDLTFSAPKSVSLAWALSDPELRRPSSKLSSQPSARPSPTSKRRPDLPGSGPTAKNLSGARFFLLSSSTGHPERWTPSSIRMPCSST